MLGKLLKYEFKATARVLPIFYAAVIALAIMASILTKVSNLDAVIEANSILVYIPTVLTWMAYGIAIAAVSVLTLVVIIHRFYTNLLQSEGYLMHALPVTTSEHIVSKVVPSVVWTLASVVVITFSAVIVASDGISDLFRVLKNVISTIFEVLGTGSSAISMILGFIIILCAIAATVLTIYAAMSIGQTSDRHKILMSFVAYIALSAIESVIETFGIAFLQILASIDSITNAIASLSAGTALNLGLLGLLVVVAAEGAVYYFVTKHCLSKKLNME